MIHPRDLILTVFGFYPYDVPEQIVVGPESAVTYLGLELHADKEDWNIESKLAGIFCSHLSFCGIKDAALNTYF